MFISYKLSYLRKAGPGWPVQPGPWDASDSLELETGAELCPENKKLLEEKAALLALNYNITMLTLNISMTTELGILTRTFLS